MKCELIETYSKDKWTLYGLWVVDIGEVVVEVAAVVGVAPWEQNTAEAAGTGRGMAGAWYNDTSDYGDLDGVSRGHAINVLTEEAPKLMEVHLVD